MSTPDQMNGAARVRRLRRLAMLAATVLLAACGGNGSGSADGADDGTELGSVRVVTSVPNSYPFVAVQAGEALGTWEGLGIDVEVISGSTPTIGQVMAGGEADIALAGGTTLAANIEAGLEATIVGSNLSYWDQRIIVRSDLGIEAPEDLVGANFGITGAGSPGDYSVARMAEAFGWSEDDYTITSLENLPALNAAMTSGQIDAFAWSSQAAFELEEEDVAIIVAPAADFVGPTVLQAFGIMDSFAEEHPEVVQAFFEGYYATVEQLRADPQRFVDVLVEEWEVAEAVAERLAEESLPRLSTDGHITDEELQGLADAVAFTAGDDTLADVEVNYVHWQEFLGDLPR